MTSTHCFFLYMFSKAQLSSGVTFCVAPRHLISVCRSQRTHQTNTVNQTEFSSSFTKYVLGSPLSHAPPFYQGVHIPLCYRTHAPTFPSRRPHTASLLDTYALPIQTLLQYPWLANGRPRYHIADWLLFRTVLNRHIPSHSCGRDSVSLWMYDISSLAYCRTCVTFCLVRRCIITRNNIQLTFSSCNKIQKTLRPLL